MKRKIAVAGITAVLVSSSALLAGGVDVKPKSCTAMLISADDDSKPATQNGFRASKILDLKVRAVIPAGVVFGNGDVVTFRFTTPKGHVYQIVEVPVASKANPGEKERSMSGYPFPLQVQQPRKLTLNGLTAQSVETRLLVGGTAIMENGLYGTWGADAWIDRAQPCGAKFVLSP